MRSVRLLNPIQNAVEFIHEKVNAVGDVGVVFVGHLLPKLSTVFDDGGEGLARAVDAEAGDQRDFGDVVHGRLPVRLVQRQVGRVVRLLDVLQGFVREGFVRG